MWPPTQSIATVPMTVTTRSTCGMALTSPAPNERPPEVEAFWCRCRPTSSIFTISPTAPYTPTVMRTATTARTAACIQKPRSATSFMEMTMISRDRMKSVVMAPRTTVSSASGPRSTAGSSSSACPWPVSLPHTLCAPS